MSDKKVCELTIMDITERMLGFTTRDEIAEASGYSDYNTGTRDALTEMREDMQKLTEKEFVSKYDEKPFIIIADSSEVLGEGFKSHQDTL